MSNFQNLGWLMISWDCTMQYIEDYHNQLQKSLSTREYEGMAFNFQTNFQTMINASFFMFFFFQTKKLLCAKLYLHFHDECVYMIVDIPDPWNIWENGKSGEHLGCQVAMGRCLGIQNGIDSNGI